MPNICDASCLTSSRFLAIFTPPPLPRPPACIWALTTHTLPPISRAAATASSTLNATFPFGIATLNFLRISFA